ncbi:MAG: hypothetical protein ACT4P5_03945 [Armatimonadota bacterium]
MTDFLTRLVERSLGAEAAARPSVVPMFAPAHRLTPPAAGLDELAGETASEEAARERLRETRRPDVSMPEDADPPPAWRHRDRTLDPLPVSAMDIAASAPDDAFANRITPQAIDGEPGVSMPAAKLWSATPETATPVISARDGSEYTGPAAVVPRPTHQVDGAPASPGFIRPRPAVEPENADLPRAAPGSAAPVVRVTIGRIEVRAVHAPAEVPRARIVTPGPSLTLGEYLKQRREGQR